MKLSDYAQLQSCTLLSASEQQHPLVMFLLHQKSFEEEACTGSAEIRQNVVNKEEEIRSQRKKDVRESLLQLIGNDTGGTCTVRK